MESKFNRGSVVIEALTFIIFMIALVNFIFTHMQDSQKRLRNLRQKDRANVEKYYR